MAAHRMDVWRTFRHLLRQNKMEEAWKEVQKQSKPPQWTYNALLGLCASRKDLDAAQRLTEEMREKGLRGDAYTFGTLLDICSKTRNIVSARMIWEKASKKVKPNHVMYNAMISCHAQVKDVKNAYRVHEEKLAKGFPPDLVAFNTLMSACARAGEPENAEAVFLELQERGLKPNLVTWNCLLDAYGRLGKIDDAYRIWTEMKWANVIPDKVTETTLAEAFVSSPAFATSILQEVQRMREADTSAAGLREQISMKKTGLSASMEWGVGEKDNVFLLDLHGFSKAGAKLALLERLDALSKIARQIKVDKLVGRDTATRGFFHKKLILITGQGKHSDAGDGVLQEVVAEMLNGLQIKYSRPRWNAGRLHVPVSNLAHYTSNAIVAEEWSEILRGAAFRYVGVMTVALGFTHSIPALLQWCTLTIE
mmetsp:Transcript_1453/g.5522  ORF Transcript_1453/g.5522 Transcript_1453/m.5522 type:complete len:423 (-) Transcript_1453:1346-2614(-)